MAVAHFTSDDIQMLFEGKHIVVIGDSVQRSVYKDLVCLLREDQLLTLDELKEKGELTFQEDTLVEGGVITGLHNGTNYREVRKYVQDTTTIMFYFVTRCYGEYMQSILDDFKLDPPHVIIMNSCLWDLHRYGKTANTEYIRNISELLHAIDLAVPDEDRLFIWNATLPVRETVKAGFLPPGVGHTLPAEDIRKANLYVRDQVKSYEKRFIFLDLHKTFFKHLDLRVKDGVHWNDFAHRKITCLILSEISKHWNFEIPSKSPMSPVWDELPPVSCGRSMNDVPRPTSAHPRPLLEMSPPTRNGHMGNVSATNGPTRMNNGVRMNGFPGNFPRANGLPRPRVNVPPRPRVNVPPGPRVNGPLGPRLSVPPCLRLPLGPGMNGPSRPPGGHLMANLRPGLLGNVPIRNHRGPASNGPGKMLGKRGGRQRRGRNRSATVNPVSFRPPPHRGWLNAPPRFLNNNEYLPPGFSLNDTFPPFSGKRKYFEEDEKPAYKFPRKFM